MHRPPDQGRVAFAATQGPIATSGGPRIRFDLATPRDDPQLRRLLSAIPMEGAISLALQREPSYLDAAVVEGRFRQTLVAVDRISGEVVATASRSVRTRYVNGSPGPVGYLGALRCLEDHRHSTVLARGYAFLRRLHEDGRATLYTTLIAADNVTALGVLTSRRCGLPAYEPAGCYRTLAIPARRRRRIPVPPGVTIRRAAETDLDAILAFLAQAAPTRQFATRYEASDFFSLDGTFRDLPAEEIRLACRGPRVVGTLASWDQSAFRQTVVRGYGGPLRWLRHVYNAWAGLRQFPRLPPPGEALRYRTLALPLVEGDDPGVLRALLETTLDDHARRATRDPTCRFVTLGLHEADPLFPTVRPYATRTYEARLFLVRWEDGEQAYRELDARPPYLELGCL